MSLGIQIRLKGQRAGGVVVREQMLQAWTGYQEELHFILSTMVLTACKLHFQTHALESMNGKAQLEDILIQIKMIKIKQKCQKTIVVSVLWIRFGIFPHFVLMHNLKGYKIQNYRPIYENKYIKIQYLKNKKVLKASCFY